MQLVVTGDFFQLPPVTKGKTEPFFAFQSEAWKSCIKNVVALKQVFRQKDDRMRPVSCRVASDTELPVLRRLCIAAQRVA